MDIEQAVQKARANDQKGFEALYNATFTSKYYLALKYMGSEAAAQDVLQEAYIRAFTNLDMLRVPAKFSAWFGMIVANTAKNALVKKAPTSFSDIAPAGSTSDDRDDFSFDEHLEDDTPGPEAQLSAEERSRIVHELIDELPAEQRLCVLMYYLENSSIAEISQAMDCSVNTVKTRLYHGRQNMKDKAEDLRKRGLLVVVPLGLLLRYVRVDEENFVHSPAAFNGIKQVGDKTFSQLQTITQSGSSAPTPQQTTHQTTTTQTNTTRVTHTQTSSAKVGATAAKTSFFTRKTVAIVLGVVIGGAAAGGGLVAWSATQPKQPAPQEQTQQAPAAPQQQQPQSQQQQPQQQQAPQEQQPQQQPAAQQQQTPPAQPQQPSEEEQKQQAIADAKAKGLNILTGKVIEKNGDDYYTGGITKNWRGVKYAVFKLDTPHEVMIEGPGGPNERYAYIKCNEIELAQTVDGNGYGDGEAAVDKWLKSGVTVLAYPKEEKAPGGQSFILNEDVSPVDGMIAKQDKIVQVWPKP